MAESGKAVLERFRELTSERLERDKKEQTFAIPRKLQSNERVLQFFKWLNQRLESNHSARDGQRQIKEEIALKRARVDKLRKLQNRLSCQYKSLLKDAEVDKEHERGTAVELQKELGVIQERSAKFNKSLSSLSRTVTSVVLAHSEHGQDDKGQNGEQFISRVPLKLYFQKENDFIGTLTKYSKFQHLRSLFDMIGSASASLDLDLLNASSAEKLLISGMPPNLHYKICRELERLQKIIPGTEKERINVEFQIQFLTAMCTFVSDHLTELLQLSITLPSVSELREKEKTLKKELTGVKEDLAIIAGQRVPQLVDSLANLQISRVFHGNYDLKLARQNYYFKRLDQVLAALCEQRSRLEVFMLLLEMESHHHFSTHCLLAALKQDLNLWEDGFKGRIKALCSPNMQPSVKPKVAVHVKDSMTWSLHRMLASVSSAAADDDGSAPTVLTYANVLSQLKAVRERVQTSKDASDQTEREFHQQIAALDGMIAHVHDKVFSGSFYKATNEDISSGLNQFENNLGQIELNVRDILQNREKRKKQLEHDPLLQKEHDLFQVFMTDGEQLQRMLEQLAVKINDLSQIKRNVTNAD